MGASTLIEATASFRHFRFALSRTTSERTLSDSFALVIVRAVALISLFISSVTLMHILSSSLSLIGIATWQAAKILPINRPFANVDSTSGGMEKLSLDISAALVFAAWASLWRYGVVEKFESKSTPSRLISVLAFIRLEPTLIWP